MIHRVLQIGRWVVDFLFAKEGYDIEGVLACLYDAGASNSVLEQAEDLMLSCKYNCGFTYSDQRRRRAVVLIGPTSSGDEFTNTLAHELYHLSAAIAQSLGIDLNSESPAYLTGNTMQELIDIVCSMGCSKCH